MTKKLLGWGVAAFLVYYLFTNPHGAAHSTGALFGVLEHAGNSLGAFLSSLGS